MNAEQLIKHFDRISDAPDAIPRLKRFILDLAVRGKLVDQDPDDEAANNLLLKSDKGRQEVAKSDRRADSNRQALLATELRWSVPSTWAWSALSDLVLFVDYRGKTPNKVEHGVRLITAKNVRKGFISSSPEEFLEEAAYRSWMTRGLPKTGDILFTTEAPMGNAAVVRSAERFALAQRVICFRPYAPVNVEFIVLQLLSEPFQAILNHTATGLTAKGIKGAKLKRLPVAIPPLAEQQRIVAKVDEVMALCDRLEQAQKQREARRDQLATASLHQLNNGTEGNDLRDAARFFVNQLPKVTARPDQIERLRRAILNLAFRGLFRSQADGDEHAEITLARIRTERKLAEESGKMKPLQSMPAVNTDKQPYPLPPTWQWTRLGQLVINADAGWSPLTEGFPRSGEEWGVLKVSAVSWDRFLPDENKQLLPGVVPPAAATVMKGDFLISRANTSELIAKSVIVEHAPHKLILSDKIVRLRLAEECDKRFVSMINNHADYARQYYSEKASGTSLSMKNVSRDVIYALPIPFPPLAEQRRLVAGVCELMAVCDQLETQLAATDEQRRTLLEAVLYEALAA